LRGRNGPAEEGGEGLQSRPQTGRTPPPTKYGPSKTGSLVFRKFYEMNSDEENIWRESKITATRAKQN
jgi:hypothetical protein